MIFEFQREDRAGDWVSLGIARTLGRRFDIGDAVIALKATHGGPLPEGAYRVRALELAPRWHYAEVDGRGIFRRTDEPDPPA